MLAAGAVATCKGSRRRRPRGRAPGARRPRPPRACRPRPGCRGSPPAPRARRPRRGSPSVCTALLWCPHARRAEPRYPRARKPRPRGQRHTLALLGCIICPVLIVSILCCQFMEVEEDPAKKKKLFSNTLHIYISYWWEFWSVELMDIPDMKMSSCSCCLLQLHGFFDVLLNDRSCTCKQSHYIFYHRLP